MWFCVLWLFYNSYGTEGNQKVFLVTSWRICWFGEKVLSLCFWKRWLRYLHLPELYGSDLIEGDPLRTRFQRIKQKGYLDDTKILFWDLYITEYTALVNFIIRHAELTSLNPCCLGFSSGSSQDTDIRDEYNHWYGLHKAN